MGPRQYVAYSPSASSFSSLSGSELPRKNKRKGKYQLEIQKPKKNRSSAVTFQKKLYAFNYKGPDAPDTFTRSDKDIVMRGLLPQISVSATENEVRNEICEVVQSCVTPNLSEIGPGDFQFINMSGRQASVPHCKRKGFEWNGRAVKELAGSGAVYIRLTKAPANISDDDDGVDLSSEETLLETPVTPSSCPATLVGTSDASTANFTSVTTSDVSASVSRSLSGTSAGTSSVTTGVSSVTSVGTSDVSVTIPITPVTSPIVIESDDYGDDSNIARLKEIFHGLTDKQLRYIYNLSGSVSKAMECLLEGPSIESMCNLVTSQMTLDDSPRIRLEKGDTEEDWTESALAFYKQGKFVKSSGLRVSIRGQPAIDAGGVRRQFFAVVFSQLARTDLGFSVFEGFPSRLRPVFKASILSSGMLVTVGTMIAHSLILDGQGFPFLSEYCYYYIAGCYDQAVTCVTTDDVGANVKIVLDKVKLVL